jgi:hypothetical protein
MLPNDAESPAKSAFSSIIPDVFESATFPASSASACDRVRPNSPFGDKLGAREIAPPSVPVATTVCGLLERSGSESRAPAKSSRRKWVYGSIVNVIVECRAPHPELLMLAVGLPLTLHLSAIAVLMPETDVVPTADAFFGSAHHEDRRLLRSIPNPAINVIPALIGSGTFERSPFANSKSPAAAASDAVWPRLCEKSVKSSALAVPS